MTYSLSRIYDASNPRDRAVHRAADFVAQEKLVPLLNVVATMCCMEYAKDQEVANALKHAVSFILDRGTKEDIRVTERCLRSNIQNQTKIRFGERKTLLGQVSQDLLKDERFIKARPLLPPLASYGTSDRYKPMTP